MRVGLPTVGLWLLALVACGPRSTPVPAPGTAAGTAADPTAVVCRIVDDRVEVLEELVVVVEGFEPFRLFARDVSVTAEFATGRAPAVQVRGRLAFSAAAQELPLQPEGGPIVGGGVTLTNDSRIVGATADGDGLRADVVVGLGVTVRGVRLPCDGLAVDLPQRAPGSPPTTIPGEPALFPASLPLRLADGPLAGPTLTVEADDPSLLPFLERERQGEKVLVSLEWSGGAALSGWAPGDAFVDGVASGFGGPSGGGEGSCPPPGRRGGPRLYCGPADVANGATVHVEPEAGAWGTVVDGRQLEVVAVEGEAWVGLRRVPGLTEDDRCGDLRHAWVAREKVRLPQDGPRPRPGTCEDGTAGVVALPQEVHLPCESLVDCPDSAALPVIVRNCSAEPVVLTQLEFAAPEGGAIRRWEPAAGTARLEPGDRFEDTMLWGAGSFELRVLGQTDDGFPFEVSAPLTIRNLLREAAQEACRACNGTWGRFGMMQLEGCDCVTGDAGRPCTSGTDCEGRCMFDGWSPLADDDPSAAGAPTCAAGEQRLIARGRCSERTAVFGCVSVLQEVLYDCRRAGLAGRAPTTCID